MTTYEERGDVLRALLSIDRLRPQVERWIEEARADERRYLLSRATIAELREEIRARETKGGGMDPRAAEVDF